LVSIYHQEGLDPQVKQSILAQRERMAASHRDRHDDCGPPHTDRWDDYGIGVEL
jgi:hypothetical protein